MFNFKNVTKLGQLIITGAVDACQTNGYEIEGYEIYHDEIVMIIHPHKVPKTKENEMRYAIQLDKNLKIVEGL